MKRAEPKHLRATKFNESHMYSTLILNLILYLYYTYINYL
jgi:hypothetical protein